MTKVLRSLKLSWSEIGAVSLLSWLTFNAPALAHHAMASQTPTNMFEGFLSGLAHPVIGFDHLAFVVAVGLLAAQQGASLFFPVAFLLMALLGTGLHLQGVNLPAAEVGVALSVILFGALLLLNRRLSIPLLMVLGAIAGLFHGYAYGESIVGAGMAPLTAYLLGFTAIQLAIALGARQVGLALAERKAALRFPAMAICAIGVVFLTGAIVG